MVLLIPVAAVLKEIKLNGLGEYKISTIDTEGDWNSHQGHEAHLDQPKSVL